MNTQVKFNQNQSGSAVAICNLSTSITMPQKTGYICAIANSGHKLSARLNADIKTKVIALKINSNRKK